MLARFLRRCARRQNDKTRESGVSASLQGGGLFAAAGLELDVDVHERDRGRSDSGNAGGVAESARTNFEELFLHLAREAADGAVVEPVGNGALLGLLEAIDRTLLLREIAGVLDFSFDGFEVVARLRGERNALRAIVLCGVEELMSQFLQNGGELLD